MERHETPIDGSDRATDCSTASSFEDHGIDDAADLITGTHRRLERMDDPAFEPTEAFFDRLEEAFLWEYLGTAEDGTIPDSVAAAIDDARVLTAAEFADDPAADLRTDVLPTFYQHVAAYHCAYHEPDHGAITN